MRRYAHCLVLLMVPYAASATDALSDARGPCVYSPGDAASQRQGNATTTASAAAPVKPATTTATSAGGGGDDDVLQRIRAPKWHSFLPGMFR
ncbi:hypothetical protein [Stenotrophomonas sp. 24(2023)]|uniref:hypothetical protein n=1 Tax=Stenotrophomonas sp. 24(2023) TaxID=3068324 RepID=UPI0027E15895|nr:hypothetical protein [Stenotrophomonas sp. 24(2023)]WMJ71331.1 hypothetical protein Q9R17_09615 [Stenotrophomonas sp. 24(2023)]